ncbi:AMP-binding protein [Actinocatenispora rupis]|uniref:Fatty acid CoA ligase n=1 Tax=Actinocatenispora rupis TaxID=519421 RepID=A0A8J3J2G9_9ACTN|nr:AMP-binding protein [Actinocatenispora rupis]GID10351.1 fatty acid CoA ligase [Actinocatenispora rupis]
MPARYVTDLIGALGEQNGGRTALTAGGRTWSFAGLLADTYRTARALRGLGVARGDGLVLLTANTPDALLVRLAAYVAGLRFTHVHLEPAMPTVPHIVADAAPALVVTAGDPHPATPRPRWVHAGELAALAAAEPAEPVPVAAEDDDLARVTYTGGTTGLPKGVPTTYGALHAAARSAVAGAAAARDGLADRTDRARFLAVTPVAHVAGDLALIMLTLGVAVETYDFEPGRMLRTLADSPDDTILTYLYPALLSQLLDHPDLPRTDTRALSLLVYGSAPASPARLRAALDRFGPVLQQGYASTEAPAITALTAADHARPELLSSVGRALPGVELSLRDPSGTPVADGDVGEVCVRSRSVMTGYWRRPDETAAVLRDGWLHTGDLGRLDPDGYLYLVGRARDMVVVGGRNCYAVPIEAALTDHPRVRAAAVVGVPDETTGEAIVAYVVVDAPVDPDELRALVTARLGAVHAPRDVRYVDALPLTALGKPDKNALRGW